MDDRNTLFINGQWVVPSGRQTIDVINASTEEVMGHIPDGDANVADAAVRIANGTPYGLAGSVWASTDERAMQVARRLRTGQVDINGGGFNLMAPFGGFKQSGHGRELGRFGLEEFLETKSMQFRPAKVA